MSDYKRLGFGSVDYDQLWAMFHYLSLSLSLS